VWARGLLISHDRHQASGCRDTNRICSINSVTRLDLSLHVITRILSIYFLPNGVPSLSDSDSMEPTRTDLRLCAEIVACMAHDWHRDALCHRHQVVQNLYLSIQFREDGSMISRRKSVSAVATLDETQVLDIGDGLIVNDKTLEAYPDTAKAITVDAAGIGINVGSGLVAAYTQLHVLPNGEKGIVVGDDGVGVNAGDGLQVSNGQLAVSVNADQGIVVEDGGLAIKTGDGVQITNNRLVAKANAAKALMVETAGVGVNAGNGLQVSNNQLLARVNTARAVVVDAAGIGVNFGNGLQMIAAQLAARSNAARAVMVDAAGIGVNFGNGLQTLANQLTVRANSARGMATNTVGVGLTDLAWQFIMARTYGASHAAYSPRYSVFATALGANSWMLYIVPRAGVLPYTSIQFPAQVNGSANNLSMTGLASPRTGAPTDERILLSIGYTGVLNGQTSIWLALITPDGGRLQGSTATFQAVPT
jgi:hypothetical protein